MPRPSKFFPANGRLSVVLTPEQFSMLDALAMYWRITRTAAVIHLIERAAELKIPFDVTEQSRMSIRSPDAPNDNVHLRYVSIPGEYGGPLHVWCFDPDVDGKVKLAEPQFIIGKIDDVAALKIPRTTVAKALTWAATHAYRPPGWPHLPRP
jgi:hypothetical protein